MNINTQEVIYISTKLVLEADKPFPKPQTSVNQNDKDKNILIDKYTTFQQIKAYMILAIQSSESNISW